MSILIRYAPSSLTRETYDKVNQTLRESNPGGIPSALQLHALFGDEGDMLVSEIWESEEAWRQAWDGGLKAALSAAGVDISEPEKYPVQELWGSRVADA
jgi:hypothetical protein